MLTFEKVLKVFQAYLDDDPLYEVVQTSHGYTLMAWEPHRNDWYSAEIQKTPEDLRNALLGTYANFLEDKITGNDRDLTVTETGEIIENQGAIPSLPVMIQLIKICGLPVERYFNPEIMREESEQRQRSSHKLKLCPE